MKFSEQWLRSWVNPQVSREELVARLSMVGLEVDAVTPVAGSFSGVVVGEVLETAQHPDADKLRVCQVSNGKETFQVVCGAPNVRAGLKIPFAMIGAQLPGDFKIKKAKLRGVESSGMLCSETELQIGSDDSGLMELAAGAPVGADLREYLDLDDVSIEIGLTPNRGDCLSLAGLAREVGAIYGAEVRSVDFAAAKVVHQDVRPVEVLAPKACPRYLGRVIRNVDLSRPAPLWMVERLRRSDIRSIDAVVDVTNYVMLELGQPLHAFDLDEIKGGIRVRMADEGEKLVLLDGQEIVLRSDTLVIADHERPLAIAGVMGGEHSGVSASTRSIFLESAFFDTIALAGKARSYGLHTDASHRFERGVDSQLPRRAMERATNLLLEIVGGEAGPIVEAVSEGDLPNIAPVTLRAERINQMLGLELDHGEVVRLLTSLGLTVAQEAEGRWQVSVPSHRFDISLEVDLIEELGRLYGYDRLPVRYPQARLAPVAKPEVRAELPLLRRLLVARGYQEAITYSFIDPKLFELFSPGVKPLELANPISADMAAMRASLWPGLVKALQYNLNRQQSRVRLFEAGLRFVGQLPGLEQDAMLAGVVTGSREPEGWANTSETVDFFDVKADVEALLAFAGNAGAYRFVPGEHPALHPGQTARVERDGQLVGFVGSLHPELASTLGIDQPVYLFELKLAEIAEGRMPSFAELSRFPEVRRDLAVLVGREVMAQDILDCIRVVAGANLTDLKLFDVYQGKGIDPLSKSVAVGLTWQHPSRTLNDDEVNETMQKILTSLEERFNATLRK
ncbi:phenylalanine--tRNA ligase subunit beta [Stutzerimonas frequens]|jgi:phenylalanyl-tRNA synthetase beta chain|uniref:phenylalanine--tRNA ligase subunit beta n=1 Tax=Stutzerimonas frequens TaxID=2968969 RepID=UPI0012691FAA|nr:phenylalanine--tRNA ligase subunit beta [Stutzerimonas frequens]MBA4727295.1 phenylalanine--tRNA ligase subunit beta [Pseudomonas sp.]NCT79366.1 phenylalanine--tRNA ligase subunit beta [Stutzerimonas stutzeri]MBK3871362.1 phenylalanine--tRNA ligase subunit beta [Stutzerimonas frequens]MBK3909699.1 phenylalanine--tRNA ligase subunit beta [Stutzerimonas frequens]MBK3916841.1 phenylalanine--tRNA ligase subunit beta [Stutzerimonas frequens]|tara:strand:+ start:1171 stop:3549 length:2379 start_codon:yes stop_codon:yes gene_type:complete